MRSKREGYRQGRGPKVENSNRCQNLGDGGKANVRIVGINTEKATHEPVTRSPAVAGTFVQPRFPNANAEGRVAEW